MANADLVASIYDAFTRRDFATITKLISPNVTIVQSTQLPWGGQFHGHAGLQQFLAKLTTHVTSRVTIDHYLDAGDHIVAIGHTTGTVNANNKPFHIPIAHVWHIQNNQVIAFHPYIHNPDMLAALA